MRRTRDDNQTYFTKHNIKKDSISLRTGQSIQEAVRGDNVYYWSTEAFTLCSSSGSKITWEQFRSEAAGGGGGGGSGDSRS